MNNEHPNIATRDWRLNAITTLAADWTSPDTGTTHPVGTEVVHVGHLRYEKEIFSVPVANGPAMYLSLAIRASQAGRSLPRILESRPQLTEVARERSPLRRIEADAESKLYDCQEQLLSSVIFSFTSLEAYANSLIPEDAIYRRVRSDKRCTEEYTRDQIERHLTLDEKFDQILPQLLKRPSPKGTSLWERYVRLQKLRDRFVHLKPADWAKGKEAEAAGTIWSDLARPDVPFFYKTAIHMMQHFVVGEIPRWLSKAATNAAADAV